MDQTGGSAPDPSIFKAAKKQPVALKRVLFDSGPDGPEPEDVAAAFREIDVDGGNSIELWELIEALQQAGLNASTAATENVFKEIDKNMSGDVDLDEFCKFFEHMAELNEFEQKRAQRAQFMTCLLNFCFLADIVAVGVLLLLFIRMDPDENPDSYIIARNVMMGASILLGVLFLSVILIPVFRLVFGPQVEYWQRRVEEKAKQARLAPKNNNKDDAGPGRRGGAGDAAVPPPSMNSKNRTYRPSKFVAPSSAPASEAPAATYDPNARRGSKVSMASAASSSRGAAAALDDPTQGYSAYDFRQAAWVQEEEMLQGHTSFCPMQIPRLQEIPEHTSQSPSGPLPGAVTGPMALANSAHHGP